MTEYAVYKGESLIAMGTRKELAVLLNVKEETINFYGTPSYIKRSKRTGRNSNYIVVVKLED